MRRELLLRLFKNNFGDLAYLGAVVVTDADIGITDALVVVVITAFLLPVAAGWAGTENKIRFHKTL